jgi:CDP-diacylglycerol--serine O-phosphatidyltransferase
MSSPLAAFHQANALTYLSLAAGLGAIAAAAGGRTPAAGALIAAAVIADTFDGRFARLFRRSERQRQLGVQLDSLADAIAFGAAPGVCTVVLTQGSVSTHVASWAVAAVFSMCAISRLAFYNITHEETSGFTGVPAPIAALLWASALLTNPSPAMSAAILLASAIAMVLPLRIPRPHGLALALFVLWPVVVLIGHLHPF